MLKRSDICAYCGMPATEADHIPPRCYRPALVGRVEFLLVPSCRECNSMLGARPLFTFKARRELIDRELRKKYRSFLKMPRWHHSEIEELGGRLQEFIRNSQTTREIIEMRLSYRGSEAHCP